MIMYIYNYIPLYIVYVYIYVLYCFGRAASCWPLNPCAWLGVPRIGCQDLSINGFQSRDRGRRMICIVFNSAFPFACDKASWFCSGFAPKGGLSWELALELCWI